MRKLYLLLGTFFSVLFVEGQETISFKNETYQVYPYKMEDFGYMDLEDLCKADIPFYPGKLADGKYAVLNAISQHLAYNNMQKQHELFAKKPAATFEVKNGKKEGAVVFYSKKLDKKNEPIVHMYGSYTNGQRHGRWVFYRLYETGKIRDSISVILEAGVANGTALEFQKGDFVSTRGFYKQGLAHGTWTKFRENSITYDMGKIDGWYIDSTPFGITKMAYSQGIPANKIIFQSLVGNPDFELTLKDTSCNYLPGTADSGKYYLHYNHGLTNEYGLKTGPEYRATYLEGLLNSESEGHDWYGGRSAHEVQLTDAWKAMLVHSAYEIKFYSTDHQASETFDVIGRYVRMKPGDRAFGVWFHKKPFWGFKMTDIGPIARTRTYEFKKMEMFGTVFQSVKLVREEADYTLWESTTRGVEDGSDLFIIRNYMLERVSHNNTIYPAHFLTLGHGIPQVYVEDSVRITNSEDEIGHLKKNYKIRTARGFLSLSESIGPNPDLPENRVQQLTGSKKLEWINDSLLVYRSYYTIRSKKDRIEWILPDTISLPSASMESIFDQSRIMDALTEVQPVQATLWLNGRLFEGKLDVVRATKKGSLHVSVKTRKLYSGNIDSTITIHLVSDGIGNTKSISTKYLNGLMRGHLKATSDYNFVNGDYERGLAHGFRVTSVHDCHAASTLYYQGKLTGHQVMAEESGLVKSNFVVTSSGLDGAGYIADGRQMFTCNFKNNQLQGEARLINRNAVTDSFGFQNNLPHGGYRNYYRWNDDYRWAFPRLDATLYQGDLVGKVSSYFVMGGGISATVVLEHPVALWRTTVQPDNKISIAQMPHKNNDIFYQRYARSTVADSVYWNGLNSEMYFRKEQFLITPGKGLQLYIHDPIVAFRDDWDGLYSYYFKGGIKSMEGAVKDNKRTGWWSFYTEAGVKFKEVFYGTPENSVLAKMPNTMKAKGFCRGFDSSGRVAYEGIILDEQFSSTCATDANIRIEELFYTGIFDSNGNNLILSNKPVAVSERQLTGARRFDGWWYNGKRDSTWYFYSSHGLLESAGKYKNGLKSGRWINGDLGGMNALDNSCFSASNLWEVMQLLKELDFEESIYQDGVKISSVRTSVQTDGFARNDYEVDYFTRPKGIFGKVKRL